MSVTQLGLRKKIGLNLFAQYRHNQAKLHKLNYIFWECTLRCNLKCLHCGSDCRVESAVKDMPAEDFLRAIDEIKDIVNPNETTIVLTGGEPLMRKDLHIVGNGLYERGFPWGTVTNGVLLTEERLHQLLDAGLRTITISLDGLEDAHNWLRGNNGFKKTLAAIKLLPQIDDLIFDVVTCVNQKNFGQLNDIKELLISIGVKSWRIFTIFPEGRAKTNEALQLQPKQFKGLFDFIKKTREEKKIDLSYGCEGFLGAYEREARDDFFFCQAGINVASVLANGDIGACPSIRSNFSQGNIYKDNFAEVWQNRYQVFRDRSWAKKGICADCEFFKYCEGNGIHLHNENGDLSFCHLKRMEEGEAAACSK